MLSQKGKFGETVLLSKISIFYIFMDFEFTDYTVLSEWERLTERLRGCLSETELNFRTWDLTYREVSIQLILCTDGYNRFPPLAMFDHFAYPLSERASSAESSSRILPRMILRVFSPKERSFLLLSCTDETMVVTVGTAKLFLGSLLIAVRQSSFEKFPILFVAFGEANLLGFDPMTDTRYSLIEGEAKNLGWEISEENDQSLLSLSLWTEINLRTETSFEGFYRALLTNAKGNNSSHSRLATLTRIHQWIPWGSRHDPIERITLESIFPKVSRLDTDDLLTGRQLPNAMEAPILLLSFHRSTLEGDEELALSMGLERLATLFHRSHEEPLLGENDWLNAGTRMRQVPVVHSQADPTAFHLLQQTIFREQMGPFERRLGKALLLQLFPSLQALWSEGILAGIPRLSLFWMEFVGALRNGYYKNLQRIPGCPDRPDPNQPIMIQKLAILQYCIDRARQDTRRHLHMRDQLGGKCVKDLLDALGSSPKSTNTASSMKEVEGEEFYDPIDTAEVKVLDMGRLRKTEMRLMEAPDEHLWIPATQEMGPLTSDQVQIYQDALVKLSSPSSGGNDSMEQAKLRIQSGQLRSDMSAFKAANPLSVLADFVRWHSPKDWIQEDGVGHLSVRMQGRVWQELWEECEACPADQQVPLFDHVREAEKVIKILKILT